ncbi:hypothetical protein [Pseudomonas moraviensis]|jgi:rRNA pseudouridine-1189 N-methylase Emg1 (Nep1/Mra1 family)
MRFIRLLPKIGVPRYFFKFGALMWRLFSYRKFHPIGQLWMLVAKAAPRLSKNQKTPVRLLKKQSTSVFLEGLRTDRGRDKLAFRSEIESGLFFTANAEGRGEY